MALFKKTSTKPKRQKMRKLARSKDFDRDFCKVSLSDELLSAKLLGQ